VGGWGQRGGGGLAQGFAGGTPDMFGEGGGGVGMQQYFLGAHFDKVFMQVIYVLYILMCVP